MASYANAATRGTGTFLDENTEKEVLKNGIKFGNQVVSVRDPAIRILSITMINVPSDYTNKELVDHVMKNYGTLHKVYDSIKREGGILFKIGNRVFQYTAVDKLPPKTIEVELILRKM